MSPETLFLVCNAVAAAGWLLLIFLPRRKWAAQLVSACVLPSLLAALYVFLLAANFGEVSGGFGSLAEVGKLFQNQHVLLAGWVHYLAFDLFVGAWEARDARRLGIPHLLLVPCLVLTFLFGPAGLLAYFALRQLTRRRLSVGSASEGA